MCHGPYFYLWFCDGAAAADDGGVVLPLALKVELDGDNDGSRGVLAHDASPDPKKKFTNRKYDGRNIDGCFVYASIITAIELLDTKARACMMAVSMS